MKRRQLLSALAGAGALGAVPGRRRASPSPLHDCGCAPQIVTAKDKPPGAAAFRDVVSKLRVTNMRVFGVTLDERIAQADRPYVFVKIETNEGVTGWGEATLEGKASRRDGLRDGSERPDYRQRSHAGRASLPVDVYRQLLPRRARAGVGDLWNRSGALGHTRQGHGYAGV